MRNIGKAALLNLGLMKNYLVSILFMTAVALLCGWGMQSVSYTLTFAACALSMTSVYTFSVEERNKATRLYGVLPVARRTLVAGKYLSVLLVGAAGFLPVLAIAPILTRRQPDDLLLSILASLPLYGFSTAALLPATYRFGPVKGRAFVILPFLIFWLPFFFVTNLAQDQSYRLGAFAPRLSWWWIAAEAAFVAVILFLSYLLSARIFERGEL